MAAKNFFGWLSAVLLLAGTGCDHSPEHFCENWVADTCTALKSCCQSGTTYDEQECKLQLSAACQDQLQVEKVHSGEVDFDYGAASDCAGEIKTCSDLQKMAENVTFDHIKSCANVVTGFRPVGSACEHSFECESAGEYAECFKGVCVNVVVDDATCSFSFSTGELHVCSETKFCDTSSVKPSSSDPKSVQEHEFTAKCKPPVGVGGNCFSEDFAIPCADGLFCEQTGSNAATCSKRKTTGTTCHGDHECAVGLACKPSPGGPEKCAPADGLACYGKDSCGDGKCNGSENAANCPQDCGGCFQPGDFCATDGECCSFSCNAQNQCD